MGIWDAHGVFMVFFYCTRTLRFHCTKKYAMHPLCWCLYTSTYMYISSVINTHTQFGFSPADREKTEFEHSYIHVLSQIIVILNPADGFAYHLFSAYVYVTLFQPQHRISFLGQSADTSTNAISMLYLPLTVMALRHTQPRTPISSVVYVPTHTHTCTLT